MFLVPDLVHAVLTAFLNCAIVLMPFLFISRRYRAADAFMAAFLTVLLVLTDEVLLDLPGKLLGLKWNWVGKLVETFWPVLIALMFRLPHKLTGFRLPDRSDCFLTAAMLGLGLACFHAYYFLQGQFVPLDRTDLESIAFQFTMPGLGEEMFYRGLLLAALDRWLSRPWKFFGVRFGLGCFVSSGIFIVAHVVEISPDYKIALCPDPFFYVFVTAVAFSMCYLRYKFQSVLPCILAHNIVNGLRYVGSAIFYMSAGR